MRNKTFFVTGTDTGVGKTVFAALWTAFLRQRGHQIAAIKPLSSGGRADARLLRAALGGTLTLDEINPWHFRTSLTPLLAARRDRRQITKRAVVAHVRTACRRFDTVVVEGAGGLLSPLGEGFDSRDLLLALAAVPLIVAPNRLGVVNQLLLTLEALPRSVAKKAEIILIEPPHSGLAARTNPPLLYECLPGRTIHRLAWLGKSFTLEGALRRPRVRRMLSALEQILD